ncbi:hypothetical protein HJG54_32550 [Leptolyngbya sp. NK1-12]|uniref:Photosystem II protein n=1 Tax=Leptolyngbya sp. NK1-12 TaxID=2547451 RepID=A0AA96WQQ8_9CYAN|nr:hypothetical protein HJG54_32550 [Leptolyngbya sp. NK1-12]
MPLSKFQPKRIAPIQYLLRQLNSDAGLVVPGWGTAPLMAALILLFFFFLLMILQIFNETILLDAVKPDWAALATVPVEPPPPANQNYVSTAIGVFLGLLAFTVACIAFIAYGARTYPTDKA